MAESGPRPRALLVLIAVLCWETGRAVEGLVLPAQGMGYQFFRLLRLGPVHVVLDAVAVAVALSALGYIWRARRGWAQAALVALGYFAVRTVVVSAFMLGAADRARAAFLASRVARGQVVDPERVARVFAMGFVEWRLVMSLTVFALAAWLTWRHRGYVGPDDASPSGR